VLHEAPGMTDACLKPGLILAESFRVHLPLLFDEPGGDPGFLRSARKKELSGEEGVGVVGMCLTGGFALAHVADDAVLAPVVAQLSLPFVHRAALGLSPVDAGAVRARTAALGSGCVLGLRYASDRIAPRERIDTIRALIGPALRYVELPGGTRRSKTAIPRR
jgi:hypothetical protein